MASRGTPEQEPKQQKGSIRNWISMYSGYISFVLAVVGIVAFVAGGILYVLIENIRTFTLVVTFIGVALMIVAVAVSYKRVFKALIGRRGRYSTNTVIMVIAALAVALILNFVFYDLISVRADFTATKEFTLAPQTLKIIENLKDPVKATAFYVLTNSEDQQAWSALQPLLDEYKYRSKGKFTYELVDPQEQPSVAKQYNVTTDETIAFEDTTTGRRSSITSTTQTPAGEQDITGAFLAVTGQKQKVVYFLTGHNERSVTDTSNNGYALAARGLFTDNYSVQSLDLLKTPDVPADAAALVIAGPTKDPQDSEIAAIEKYLLNGGNVLFLMDPNTPQTFRDLLAKWDVKLGTGTVVDTGSSLSTDVRTPLITSSQYDTSDPIVSILHSPSLFPDVTSVTPVITDTRETPSGVQFTELAVTSSSSWLTPNNNSTTFDAKTDTQGPVPIAAMVQANQPITAGATPSSNTTKIVAFGDSSFADNLFYTYNSNSDILLNSVDWLTGDVQLISIRPKTYTVRQLFLTSRQRNFITWSSWIIVPGFVTMLGFGVWWRRR